MLFIIYIALVLLNSLFLKSVIVTEINFQLIIFATILWGAMQVLLSNKKYKVMLNSMIVISLLIILVSSGINNLLREDPFLFADDKAYYEYASGIIYKSIGLKYQGGIHYLILEFLYDIVARNTMVGRLINIFSYITSVFILSSIFPKEDDLLRKKFLVLSFFSEMFFLSLFEFKDSLFLLLLVIGIKLSFSSIESRSRVQKTIYGIVSVFFYALANTLRVGVPLVFMGSLFISYFLCKKDKTIKVNLFRIMIISTAAIMFILVVGAIGVDNIITSKIQNYANLLLLRQNTQNIISIFNISSISDFYKIPLAITFVPYSTINFFKYDSFNLLIFSFFRLFSFYVYFNVLYLLFSGQRVNNKIYYLIILPSFVVLGILSVTSPGILRHFSFLLPFLIMMYQIMNGSNLIRHRIAFMLFLMLVNSYYFIAGIRVIMS